MEVLHAGFKDKDTCGFLMTSGAFYDVEEETDET